MLDTVNPAMCMLLSSSMLAFEKVYTDLPLDPNWANWVEIAFKGELLTKINMFCALHVSQTYQHLFEKLYAS